MNKDNDIIKWANEYLTASQPDTSNIENFFQSLIEGGGTALDANNPGAGSFAKTILSYVLKKIFSRNSANINYTNRALIQHYKAQYAFTLFVAYSIKTDCQKDEENTQIHIDHFISNDEHINTKTERLLNELKDCIEWSRLESILSDDAIFNKLKLIIMAYGNYAEASKITIGENLQKKLSFDFNNLPNSHPLYHISRDSILNEIQKCQQPICLIYADGGYGKSTILKQLSQTDIYVSSFKKGYAYSFYAQGKPQDDRTNTHLHNIILDSQEFFEKSIAYFGIDLEKTKEFIGKDSSFLTKIVTEDINNKATMLKRIFDKSKELPELLPRLLYFILSENKYLLFLDGMEVLQNFQSGAIKDEKLKIFKDLIEQSNILSKVVISSRVKLQSNNNIASIKLKNLTDDEIKNALIQKNITISEIDFNRYRQFLNVPILLNFIIQYAIKDQSNPSDTLKKLLEDLMNPKSGSKLTNSPEQTGTQTQTILAEILRKLFDGGSNKNLQDFIMVASIFDWPMNINEYDALKTKHNGLPQDYRAKEISNSNIVFLDENDAISSFDIHPMVKLFFYNELRKNSKLFKSYTQTMGEYYENLYKNLISDCKEVPSDSESRNYIFNSVNFYLKQENYIKAIELFNTCINGTNHIGKYQEHIRAYYILRSCLDDEFNLKDKGLNSEKFAIFKALIYFQMTLGKNEEAIYKSIPKIDISEDLVIPEDNQKIKEKLLKSCFDNCDDELSDENKNKELYKYIETVDWYMSVLENYKYSNKNPLTKKFYTNNIAPLYNEDEKKANLIKKFWQFQLKLRVDECKYYFEGKYPKNFSNYRVDFETMIKIGSDNDKLTLHPHNLWFERYFSSVLDGYIDKCIENPDFNLSVNLSDMEIVQVQLCNRYKEQRLPYYQQGLINMMKLKFLQNTGANYEAYRDNLIEATKKINKSDFILQAYLDIALCEYLCNNTIDDTIMKQIELYSKNTHIKFLELDYKLLSFLKSNKISKNINQYIGNLKYKHRTKRLEAIQKFKESQPQTS